MTLPHEAPGTKRCPRCDATKPLAEFGSRWRGDRNKHVVQCWCTLCRRASVRACRPTPTRRNAFPGEPKIFTEDDVARQRKQQRDQKRRARLRRYGLTPADYEQLLERQGGVCAICEEPPGEQLLHVDHDHETEAVRGLLCGLCNVGIGMLQDDPDVLESALRYLRKTTADVVSLDDRRGAS